MNRLRPLRSLLLTLAVASVGCHAQTPPPAAATTGTRLSADLARRVEVMIRSRSDVPPDYVIAISNRTDSEVPGYGQITVTFSAGGKTSRPITFLLSNDGKTLAQFNKMDLSPDPREKVSFVGRPGRGGAESAPVVIVGFDDLECPFCAKMNDELFPAVLNRYKDQVRVVYLDLPLTEIHPWAMHAAVDANCLAASTPTAYWDFVDYVHSHASELGGPEAKVDTANSALDKLVLDEGVRQKLNQADLAACVKKQDDANIKASMKQADALGVGATPALFINGEKVEGITPIENIYRIIDEALIAAGQTPPPPVQPPAVATPPAAKPGN